jgi:multiple sugar transport system permease protein
MSAHSISLPSTRSVLIWTGLLVGGTIMVTPFLLALSSSLSANLTQSHLTLWPSDPTLENYRAVLHNKELWIWFMNSVIVSVVTTVSVLIFDSLAGYALCKLPFRGNWIVFSAILSTMMIPTEMLAIPWYRMAVSLHLFNTLAGIAFPGLMTGFGVFLMKQFFEGVPDEYLDAARIDGKGELAIWWKVAMPLVRPALAALAVFVFAASWTAFLWPFLVTDGHEAMTLPVGFRIFASGGDAAGQVNWGRVMAGMAVTTFPTLFVFLGLQRYLVRGIVLSGVKG